MIEMLKNANCNIIISVLILFGLWAVNANLKELPKMVRDMLKQNREYKSNHDLQIESYFRQASNEDLQAILNRWTSFITNMEKAAQEMSSEDGTDEYVKLEHKTIMYGSPRTVHAVAAMQHFEYREDKNKPDPYKLMMYMATIACSLKRDFTGYEVNPVSLLEIKISDFDEYADKFSKYNKEIQKELDQAEKDGYVK